MGKWKALRRGLRKKPDTPFQLFDLTQDPAEATDVASEFPEIIKQVETICAAEHVNSELFPFPAIDQ